MAATSRTCIVASLLLMGCASSSEDISPSYVSPIVCQNSSCDQLAEEGRRVSQQAAIASGQQDKLKTRDTVATTAGVVLFWPALFFVDGDGPKAAEVARIVSQSVVYLTAAVAELFRLGRDDQLATAGRLTSGSSLIWPMVSSDM